MGRVRFDWRWIALPVLLLVLANAGRLPWPLTALALALPGGYTLWLAWCALGLNLGTGSTRRVTYWRGQRIETDGPPRRYRPRSFAEFVPALAYLVLGVALLGAALAFVLQIFGR